MDYIMKKENPVLCTDLWDNVGAVVDIIHSFVSDLSHDILSTASPHTFTNSRTSYSHQTDYRQERTEERGDVCSCVRILYLTFKNIIHTYRNYLSWLFIIIGVCWKWRTHCTVCLQGGFSMFIQLMPIVVLILVSILSQMMVSPPPYSLYSRPYVHTQTHTLLFIAWINLKSIFI